MTLKLNRDDLKVIDETERRISHYTTLVNKSKQFKQGDILFYWNIYTQKIESNSYGPIKYKVVHTDSNGLPYLKQLSSTGAPRGSLLSIFNMYEEAESYFEDHTYEKQPTDILMHDPHYVDHMIIAEENDEYDPSEISRKKKILRDEIIKHNKASKLDVSEVDKAVELMNNMVVGQVYWQSSKTCFTINSIERTTVPSHYGYSKRKITDIPKITVIKSNGDEVQMLPTDLWRTNLYGKKPRSYKELSDSI